MSQPILPSFVGPFTDAKAVLEYIVDPANAGLLDLDARVQLLTTAMLLKLEHTIAEVPPQSAQLGWIWTRPSTGVTSYCNSAYDENEPAPETKFTAFEDSSAQSLVQTVAQLTSPTPQVPLLTQTIQGIATDGTITPAEKNTIKIVYDELLVRKTEIDLAVVRYSLSGTSNYTDYTDSYGTWLAYINGLDLFSDMNSSSSVSVISTWNSEWNGVLSAESTILDNIRSSAQDVIDTISGNLSTVQAQMDEMSDDGVISPTEKIRFRDEWTRVQDEYSKLSAQATLYSLTGDSEWTTLASTFSSLQTYLGSTTSAFADMDTALVLTDVSSNASEWQGKWQNYYADAKVFDTHVDEYFSGLISTQQASLDSALSTLTALADDNVISGGSEKETLQAKWKEIQRLDGQLQFQAGTYGVAIPASYTTALDALSTYLNTEITVFDDMSVDTSIARAVFNSKFDDYGVQYDALAQAVVTAQKNQVDSEPADYDNFKTLINNVVDDGVISAGAEKTRFNAIWLDIQATHSTIKAKATNVGVNTTGFQSAYDDLASYIGGLTAPGGSSPNFTIEGEDTAIGVATFHGKMRTYESAKATLESDIISTIINLQQDSAKSILDINDDGIVSVAEKGTTYKEWNRLTAEKSQLDTQATNLGITTAKDAMNTAYNTLETYLNSLAGGNGLFNDLSTATTLSQAEKDNWDTNWNNLYSTMAGLETEIISTIQGNVSAVGSSAFRKDGTVPATGDFDMANYAINNLLAKTLASGGVWAVTTGQLWTEQQARLNHEADTSVHGTTGNVVGDTDIQTITNKTINADNNAISELEVDNLKAGVVEADVLGSVTADDSTLPSTKATKEAIVAHSGETAGVHGATGNVVGDSDTQTLTNKTIDGGNNTIQNLNVSHFDPSIIDTDLTTTSPSHNTLATALAVKNLVGAGGGGGGGGGTVDLEWVTAKDVEALGTGLGAEVVNGTLSLPAGKKWKWVKIVYYFHQGTAQPTGDNAQVLIDAIDDTSNFAVSSAGTNSSTGQDSSNTMITVEGAPSVIDQDIDVVLKLDNPASQTDKRSAYIVGICAGDPQATEEYGVYTTGSASATTTVTTGLVGTRIDITDPDYATSAFTFNLKAYISSNYPGSSGGEYTRVVNATIKKQSGGDPFAIVKWNGDFSVPVQDFATGALATGGSKVTSNDESTVAGAVASVELERVESSNELCFRIILNDDNSADWEYLVEMTGPKSYNGTDITSSNGTLF